MLKLGSIRFKFNSCLMSMHIWFHYIFLVIACCVFCVLISVRDGVLMTISAVAVLASFSYTVPTSPVNNWCVEGPIYSKPHHVYTQ